jgi:hypothetical protein
MNIVAYLGKLLARLAEPMHISRRKNEAEDVVRYS